MFVSHTYANTFFVSYIILTYDDESSSIYYYNKRHKTLFYMNTFWTSASAFNLEIQSSMNTHITWTSRRTICIYVIYNIGTTIRCIFSFSVKCSRYMWDNAIKKVKLLDKCIIRTSIHFTCCGWTYQSIQLTYLLHRMEYYF